MTKTITQDQVLINVSRLMGLTSLPAGDVSDWKEYCQIAFDYAWRYYKWDWSLKVVTVDLVNDPYLPADFDAGGYIDAIPTVDGAYTKVTLIDFARTTADSRRYTLQYDADEGKYEVKTKMSGLQTMDFVYQVAPPTLSTTPVVFPSAMAVALGALVYAKQAENPTRADITQEWDEFHAELDRHIGRMEVNKAQGQAMNLYDIAGTYPGDTR